MFLPREIVDSAAREACASVVGAHANFDPQVRRAQLRKFGQYQINGVMSLAKDLRRQPRDLAIEIADILGNDSESFSVVEVAGPGFINVTMTDVALIRSVVDLSDDPRLGVQLRGERRTVLIDYSAPNVAKEMHVGHLRSTIIGDSLVRLNRSVGNEVICQNHVGDWGTPFGMLIEHLLDLGESSGAHSLKMGELNSFYQDARKKFESSEEFANRARQRVVLLQSGDAETMRLWEVLRESSEDYFSAVYSRLNVELNESDLRPESAYNDLLDDVVAELDRQGLLALSDGAKCVFPDGFVGRDGSPLPLIVQKTDGGYGYAATDLAAIRDRARRLNADRILYVVGAPQANHLQMVFAVAEQAGWLAGCSAEHVPFGSVLGEDGRMLRTRAGDSVKLIDLLDEAVSAAASLLDTRDSVATNGQIEDLARMTGIGAVKYADLSSDRVKDYVFGWDRMLAFDGDTALYLQYAHARMRSILRRAEGPARSVCNGSGLEESERDLILELCDFGATVSASVETNHPHTLCGYLYSLARAFSRFYENCSVLSAVSPETVAFRLELCRISADILRRGLDLLGIEAPDEI